METSLRLSFSLSLQGGRILSNKYFFAVKNFVLGDCYNLEARNAGMNFGIS
jgi:hypothetical protein